MSLLISFRKALNGFIFLTFAAGSAQAFNIESEDGTVNNELSGFAQFSGGTEDFVFRFHEPVEDSDLLSTVEQERPLAKPAGPLFLLQEYGTENIGGSKEFQAVMDQSARGGLAASFSDMVLQEIQLLSLNCVEGGAPVEDAKISPIYSNIRLHVNPIRTNAVLNVFSLKWMSCKENQVGIPIARRWVISVPDGLEEGDITGEIDGTPVTYKLFARGENVQLMAYYSNLTLTGPRWGAEMRLISGYDQFGNVDPRDAYYDLNEDSCLDIDFVKKPTNDDLIISSNEMRFCARGCIPGDVSATK